MKSVNRLLVLTMACGSVLLAMPRVTRASDARVEGLAIPLYYIDDEEGSEIFPTVYARVNNIVTAGFGTSSNSRDNRFGVIASGDREGYGVFSLQLRGTSPFLDAMSRQFDADYEPGINIPSQQFDLGWARQFGKMALGARLEYAKSKITNGDDEVSPAQNAGNDNWNTMALHGGLKLDMARSDFLEIGAEARNLSFTNDLAGTEDDAGLSYRVSARWWKMINEKVDFVPAFNYSHVDVTAKGGDDETYNALHAGGAFLFDVNQDNLLTLGAAVNHQKDNLSDASATWLPTLFGSLEWDVKSWLTGRVGAQQAMRMSSLGDNDATSNDFGYGVGVGLHFNNFDLDATLNEDFLFNGAYFISGDNTSGMFGRVTGTYRF